MLITVVGNHCTWTRELSTSYILNNDTLIDVPQGSFKTLYNDYDINKVENIFITHFHSDHFADIHLIIDIFNKIQGKKLKILAPKGCKERIIQLFKILEVGYLEKYLDDNVTFFDCENRKTFKIGNFKVKTYKVAHKNLDAYGFVIDDGKVKVGFSGDSSMCNSVHKIIKHSKVVFIDCASTNLNNSHLTVGEVAALQDEYKDVVLYPVHFSINSENAALKTKLAKSFPGQVIEI